MKVERDQAEIKIKWDVKNKNDMEEAKRFFMNLTKQGWLAVYISKKNGKQHRALEFIDTQGELYFILSLKADN